MSGNSSRPVKKVDPRARRTRDLLGDALVLLMHQKPFDAITVQDVLDQAEISRSTFYSHFQDKNDLFMSDVDDFFEQAANVLIRRGERSHRVAPIREFFEHVAEWREFHAAVIAADKLADVWELGRLHFARGIEARLAEVFPEAPTDPRTRAALAHAFSGAMFSMLSWWLDHGASMTPAQMDDLFHSTVKSAVEGASAPR